LEYFQLRFHSYFFDKNQAKKFRDAEKKYAVSFPSLKKTAKNFNEKTRR